MASGSDEYLRVCFPASAPFAAVGRVAVAGLALRLGFDVASVENVRLAIDTATAALRGDGEVTITAHWDDNHLDVQVSNPASTLSPAALRAVEDELAPLVPTVAVDPTSIELALHT